MAVRKRKKNPKRAHCGKCGQFGHHATAHKRRKHNPWMGGLTGPTAIYRALTVL